MTSCIVFIKACVVIANEKVSICSICLVKCEHCAKTNFLCWWIVSRCFASLRQLRQIRHFVPTATLQMLVVALVHSQLDYGNSVLVSLPAYLLRQLQSVLSGLSSESLRLHHWRTLSVSTGCEPQNGYCILAVLTDKAMHGGSPSYLISLVHVANV